MNPMVIIVGDKVVEGADHPVLNGETFAPYALLKLMASASKAKKELTTYRFNNSNVRLMVSRDK